MTSEHQNGKPCTGLVLLETGPGFHRDQDNTEIRVLDECSGTAASIGLPSLFLPHVLYFVWNQYLQQRVPEVWKSVQSIGRSINLCRDALCSHILTPFGKVTRPRRRGLPRDCCPRETAPGELEKFLPAGRIGARIGLRIHRKARRTRWLVRVCSRRSHWEYPCTAPRAAVHRTGTAFLRGDSERVFRIVGWSIGKSLATPAVTTG